MLEYEDELEVGDDGQESGEMDLTQVAIESMLAEDAESESVSSSSPSAVEPMSSGSSYQPEEPERNQPVVIPFAYKKLAVDFRDSGLKKRRFSCVQSKFKLVKEERDLYRWQAQVKEYGDRAEKLSAIWKGTKKAFDEAKSNQMVVRDRDLRRMAIRVNGEIGLSSFKASPY